MKTQKWYLMEGGQRVGPLTFDEIKAKNLQRETQVYCALLGKWTKASSVEELDIEKIPSAPVDEMPPMSIVPAKNEFIKKYFEVCSGLWRNILPKISKLHCRWQGFDGKTKITIVGGATFVMLVFYLLLPGRNQEAKPGQQGYRGINAKVEKIVKGKLEKLIEKYGTESDVPKDVNARINEEIDKEVDAILATCEPVPATIDESASRTAGKIKHGNPTLMKLGFFGWKAHFPVTLSAISQIPRSEYTNGLIIRVYDADGAALEEAGITLNTDAISGESVIGHFTIEFAHLEKMKEIKLFRKSKKAF